MSLLVLLAAIVAIIIYENNSKQKIMNSKDFRDWRDYYLNSGYSEKQATDYALAQCRKGDKLENYDIDPQAVSVNATSRASIETKAKEQNPYASINWILAVACFCVIAGLLVMVSTINSKLVAPLFVLVALALFAIGYAIYKYVAILKPVGSAFLISSMILLPCCLMSFIDIFDDEIMAAIVTSLLCLLFYAGGAFVLNNKILGGFSYFWAMCLLWSLFAKLPDSLEFIPYQLVLPVFIICYIANYFYFEKVEWLPVCFRSGALVFSLVLPPLLLCYAACSILIDNFALDFPFHRTIVLLLIFAIYAWRYFKQKSTINNIKMRFLGQFLILFLIADSINYSIFMTGTRINTRIINFSIIWAFSFFAQAVATLLIKHKDDKDNKLEGNAGIGALFGLAGTLLIAGGLPSSRYGVVACVVLALLAALGAIYAIRRRNLDWLYASYVALVILAYILGTTIFKSSWTTLHSFIYFTTLSLLAVVLYQIIAGLDETKALRFTLIASLTSSIIATIAGMDYFKYDFIAWVVPALSTWLIFAMAHKHKILLELSIYFTALTAIVLVSDVATTMLQSCGAYPYDNFTHGGRYSLCRNNILDVQKFIQINVLGLTFLLTSFLFESWKKKGEKKPWRMVVAHLSFSILGSLIALFAHSYHEDLTIGLIFLLEEAAILVGASLIQKRWMAIMSGVIIGFGGVYLTGLYKYTYIWMILLGLGLIGLVVWRLVALSKKETNRIKKG